MIRTLLTLTAGVVIGVAVAKALDRRKGVTTGIVSQGDAFDNVPARNVIAGWRPQALNRHTRYINPNSKLEASMYV